MGVAAIAGRATCCSSWGDGRPQLRHRALGPGQRLRAGPAPLVLLGLAYRVLHPPQPGFQLLTGVPRHGADLLPALLDAAQRGTGGPYAGDRQQRLGLLEQFLLGGGVLMQKDSLAGCVPGANESSLLAWIADPRAKSAQARCCYAEQYEITKREQRIWLRAALQHLTGTSAPHGDFSTSRALQHLAGKRPL